MRFSIPIRPKPKERPRFANGHAYTPKGTREYEKLIAYYAKQAGATPSKLPLIMTITATFKSPIKRKSFYCVKRPDIDNLQKMVFDALNGVAYEDDAQIVEATITKEYGEKDLLEIEIEYL